MTRLHRMWQRAFEREFLELRANGVSEDAAIELAERRVNEGLDRYVDAKLEERYDAVDVGGCAPPVLVKRAK